MLDAVWKLEGFLKRELPGLRNLGAARDLMTLVCNLVHFPTESLTGHAALTQLKAFVERQEREADMALDTDYDRTTPGARQHDVAAVTSGRT